MHARNLLCGLEGDMISEFWSSKIAPGGFFPNCEAFDRQSTEVLLQSVVAKANFAKESSEIFGFMSLSAANTRSSKKSITASNRQNVT